MKITGKIDHTNYTKGQSGTVEFNRFPATVDEFKAVREKIGGEPHGAVALQVMAMEMYRRDRSIGLECIKLNNTLSNVNAVVSRLKELFGGDINYNRPYQIAAYLKGAEPGNGYNPTKRARTRISRKRSVQMPLRSLKAFSRNVLIRVSLAECWPGRSRPRGIPLGGAPPRRPSPASEPPRRNILCFYYTKYPADIAV